MAKVHRTNRTQAGRRSAQVFLPFGEIGSRSVHKLNKLAVKRNLGREISIVIGNKRKYYRIVQSGKSVRFKRLGEPGAPSKIIEIESPITSAIAQRKRPIGDRSLDQQAKRRVRIFDKEHKGAGSFSRPLTIEMFDKGMHRMEKKGNKRRIRAAAMALSEMGIFDARKRSEILEAVGRSSQAIEFTFDPKSYGKGRMPDLDSKSKKRFEKHDEIERNLRRLLGERYNEFEKASNTFSDEQLTREEEIRTRLPLKERRNAAATRRKTRNLIEKL